MVEVEREIELRALYFRDGPGVGLLVRGRHLSSIHPTMISLQVEEPADYVVLLIEDCDDSLPRMALDQRLPLAPQACMFHLHHLGGCQLGMTLAGW